MGEGAGRLQGFESEQLGGFAGAEPDTDSMLMGQPYDFVVAWTCTADARVWNHI